MKNDKKPHVIYLIIDAGGFGHTSLAGYFRDTTPFLKEFSKECVQYPLAFAQGPISGLSIGSFTTSSYAFDHKDCPIEVRPSRPSIASVLQKNGYYTSVMTSNPYYARKLGHDQGVDHYKMFFEESDEIRRIAEKGLLIRALKTLNKISLYRGVKEWIKKNLRSLYNAGRMRKQMMATRQSPFGDAAQANKEILKLLNDRPQDKPLFLLTQYMDLHAPHLPPDEFLRKFGGTISKQEQYIYWQRRSMRPLPEFSQKEVEDLTLLYDACLAHIDSRIRDVVNELKREGMYDDSLIIISADHGEAFFEHGDLGHHGLLYEENIRVPLLIKYPHGIEAGTSRDSVVSLIDVAPTILGAAGVKRPGTFVGKDLQSGSASASNQVSDDHAVSFVAFRFSPENFTRLNFENYALSVRTKNWKLIVQSGKPDELYNLEEDPKEKSNLLETKAQNKGAAEAYQSLREMMQPYLDRVSDRS